MKLTALTLAAALAAPTAVLAGPDQGLALGGVDAATDSFYVYGGVLYKLSGRLGDSGPVVRLWGDNHRYEYGQGSARVDAERHGGHLAGGWQFKFAGGGHFSAYLGAAYHSVHRRLETPPFPTGDASEWGAMGQLDLNLPMGSAGRFETIAHYDTSFDDYWVRGRLLFSAGPVKLGPEVVAQGNEDYSAVRAGLALADWRVVDAVDASIAAGWEDRDEVDGNGYVNLGLAVPFSTD